MDNAVNIWLGLILLIIVVGCIVAPFLPSTPPEDEKEAR
jgi:hypothetical protein